MKNIRIVFEYPRIPDRNHDYRAYFDGEEELNRCGWGASPEAALGDLLGQEDDISGIQADWNARWRNKRRWIIVEEGDGSYSIHEHSKNGVAPPTAKPGKREVAARLLQLLGIGPVAPQDYPEEVCVGVIERESAEVLSLNPARDSDPA